MSQVVPGGEGRDRNRNSLLSLFCRDFLSRCHQAEVTPVHTFPCQWFASVCFAWEMSPQSLLPTRHRDTRKYELYLFNMEKQGQGLKGFKIQQKVNAKLTHGLVWNRSYLRRISNARAAAAQGGEMGGNKWIQCLAKPCTEMGHSWQQMERGTISRGTGWSTGASMGNLHGK